MGMFDSFRGEYICTACGNTVVFEEQTKDYERLLEDFYVGDYCDCGNANYYYNFVSYCPKCHADHEISLAIRRGQFVGIYYKYEADEVDIMQLDNIEEGYERHRLYERKCERKLGSEPPRHAMRLRRRRVGAHIEALKTRWEIKEVYQEVRNTEEKLKFTGPDKCYVYRVTDGTDERIITMELTRFTRMLHISVLADDLNQEKTWNDDYECRYRIQQGCELKRIE